MVVTDLVRDVGECGHALKVHAGAYALLDLQQLATHSLPDDKLSRGATWP